MRRGGWAGLLVGASLAIGYGTVSPRRTSTRPAASYLPLEVGAIWRYAIATDDGRRGTGTVSVDGVDYGGSNGAVREYRIREELPDETVWTWDDREAGRVAREQEEVDDRT